MTVSSRRKRSSLDTAVKAPLSWGLRLEFIDVTFLPASSGCGESEPLFSSPRLLDLRENHSRSGRPTQS
jgi:hypothetical protein